MPHEGEFTEVTIPSINVIHDEALIQHFEDGIGKKIFIMSSSFPFVFIGRIREVIEDYVVVDVETTPNQSLENRKWHIHIHNIELFFIERDNGPKIPELKDDIF